MDTVMITESEDEVEKKRLRVKTIINGIRLIAKQAWAFHGHEHDPENCGNFIELVKLTTSINDKVAEAFLGNAPEDDKYASIDMQKEILHVLVNKVRNKISEEVGNAKFSILFDEAQTEAYKTRFGIILRFVDDEGFVQERLFQAIDLQNTTKSTIKEEISNVLARHNLHIDNMRGHGYDGASSMQYWWDGLHASLLKDCPYSYYVHWLAHPLQHALIEASIEVYEIYFFLTKLKAIMNLIGPSSKDHSLLQSAQADEIARKLAIDGPETGKGANHIGSHCCPHFRSVSSLIGTFDAYCTVIESLVKNGSNQDIRGQAYDVCHAISFQFVLVLHLLHRVMGVTELLCQALQQKSQDILNVKNLVSTTKTLLQELKQDGWDTFLESVKLFCEENYVNIPDMNARHVELASRASEQQDITIEQHYRFNIFNPAIDIQLASCRKIYPRDFTEHEIPILRTQLQQYKLDVINHPQFQNLATVSELCRRLVETRKSKIYCLIDRLIRLVLTLPISMATTERAFLVRKFIKEAVCNGMEDVFLEDCMIMYVERELAENIDSNSIIDEVISLKDHMAQ